MEKKVKSRYTEEFRLKVLSYYCSCTDKNRVIQTCRQWNVERSTLLKWIHTHRKRNNSVSLQSEQEENNQMKKTESIGNEADYLKENKSLKEALEYERLRCQAYLKMIEIAEREENISILKKDGAKQ